MVWASRIGLSAALATLVATAGLPMFGQVVAEELAELQRAAMGDPSDPLTRQALFVLADRLLQVPGAADPETRTVLRRATALYPNDPRTPALMRQLALARIADGAREEAHFISLRVLDELGGGEPEFRVAAAHNAALVEDYAASLRWLEPVNVHELPDETRVRALVVRLRAAYEQGQLGRALAAMTDLEELDPERLRVDSIALWAAARIDEKMGRLGLAADRYELFANLHPKAAERPLALLTVVRLRLRAGHPGRARMVAEHLASEHPGARETLEARMSLLEFDREQAGLEQLDVHMDVVRRAATLDGARWAAERVLTRYVGAGFPLEVTEALVGLIESAPAGSPARLATREALDDGLPAVIALLDSREDDIGVVAAALAARAAGVDVPPGSRTVVARSRRALGLSPASGSLLEQAIARARLTIAEGRWNAVPGLIERPLGLERDADPVERAEATALFAEALWRLDRVDEAVSAIDRALRERGLDPRPTRRLRVLRADLLFAARRGESCDDYRSALEIEKTPWVESQLERCAEQDPGEGA